MAKYEQNSGSFIIIQQRIKELLSGKDIDFEKWHMETCGALLRKYDEYGLGDHFSYGNSQKWVNMSLKYLYLLSGISETYAEQFYHAVSAIKPYTSELFVPVDSYIIDVLWKKGVQSLPLKDGIKVDRSKGCTVPSEYVKGWSTWNKEEYLAVNKDIKDICGECPMEWESEEWIKRAKERRK